MPSRFQWSKRNKMDITRDFSQGRRTYLYSDIEVKEMPVDEVLAELESMTEDQCKLVGLVWINGEDSLRQAIARVKGD